MLIRRPTTSQTHVSRLQGTLSRGISHDTSSQGSRGSRLNKKTAKNESLNGKASQRQTSQRAGRLGSIAKPNSHKIVIEGKVGGKPASKPYFPAPQSPGGQSEDGSEFTPVLSGDAHVDVTVFDADENASLGNRSSSSAAQKHLPGDDASEQFDNDSESAGSMGSQGIGGKRGIDHQPSGFSGGGSIGSHAGGSAGSIAPSGTVAKAPSTVASGKFAIGDVVEAKYGGESSWYSGRIKKVNPTGTFDIEYDDGDAEESVPGGDIRLRAQSDTNIASSSIGQKFERGSRVQALYGGGKNWYSGQITKANTTGTFDIEYDDGDAEESVPGDHIRFHPQESSGRRDGNSYSGGETESNI